MSLCKGLGTCLLHNQGASALAWATQTGTGVGQRGWRLGCDPARVSPATQCARHQNCLPQCAKASLHEGLILLPHLLCCRLTGVFIQGASVGARCVVAHEWVQVLWTPVQGAQRLGAGQDQRGCQTGTAPHLCIWEGSCPIGSLQPGRKLRALAKSYLPCLTLPPCCRMRRTLAQPGCSWDTFV